jgi:hypothetical protein
LGLGATSAIGQHPATTVASTTYLEDAAAVAMPGVLAERLRQSVVSVGKVSVWKDGEGEEVWMMRMSGVRRKYRLFKRKECCYLL